MAKKWSQVTANPEFQKLPEAKKQNVRASYFNDVVKPNIGDQNKVGDVWAQFQKDAPLSPPEIEPTQPDSQAPVSNGGGESDWSDIASDVAHSALSATGNPAAYFFSGDDSEDATQEPTKTRPVPQQPGTKKTPPMSAKEATDGSPEGRATESRKPSDGLGDYSGFDLAADVGVSGMSAINKFFETSYELADLATRPIPGEASLDDVVPLRDMFAQQQENLSSMHTDEFNRQSKDAGEGEGFFGSMASYSKNPLAMMDMALTSAPYAIGMAGPAKLAFNRTFAKGLQSGLSRKVASERAVKSAAKANMASNAAIGGAASAQQARGDINNMEQAEIEESPAYQELIGEGKTDSQARKELGDRASAYAAPISGLISGAASGGTAGMEARFFTGMMAKAGGPVQFALKVGKQSGSEILEEVTQESGEAASSNIGQILSGADPDRNVSKGVAESAGPAALLGGATGAGISVAGEIAGRMGGGEKDADSVLRKMRNGDKINPNEAEVLSRAGYVDLEESDRLNEVGVERAQVLNAQDTADFSDAQADALEQDAKSVDPADAEPMLQKAQTLRDKSASARSEVDRIESLSGQPEARPDIDGILEKSSRGEQLTDPEKDTLVNEEMAKRDRKGRFKPLPKMRRRMAQLAAVEAPTDRTELPENAHLMTRDEFYADPDNQGLSHDQAVADALDNGIPVPPHVRVDYPDLVRAREEKGESVDLPADESSPEVSEPTEAPARSKPGAAPQRVTEGQEINGVLEDEPITGRVASRFSAGDGTPMVSVDQTTGGRVDIPEVDVAPLTSAERSTNQPGTAKRDASSFRRGENMPREGFTDSNDAASVAPLQEALNADEVRTNPDGTPYQATIMPVRPKSNGKGAKMRRMQRLAKDAYGVDAQFFRSDDPQAPNGAKVSNDPGRVYVNADANRPIEQVIGHELLHDIRDNEPEIYEQLKSDLVGILTNRQSYYGRAVTDRQGTSKTKMSGDLLHEEMIADVLGEHMTEPGFLSEIEANTEPNVFRRFAKRLKAFTERAIARLKSRKQTPFMAEHVRDLENARKAVSDALENRRKRPGRQRKAQDSRQDTQLRRDQGGSGWKRKKVGGFNVTKAKDGSIKVNGNPEEVHAALGDMGAKGKVIDGGLSYSSAAASRVVNILSGEASPYSRGGEYHPHPRYKGGQKKGQYIGASEEYNTPQKLPALRKRLRQLADEGSHGRYWYEQSGEQVLRMMGGDTRKASDFAKLLAIYSQSANVQANAGFALKAWSQHQAGHDIQARYGDQNKKAESVFDSQDPWQGEKTNNFYINLMRQIDPDGFGVERQGATIDIWMMRAAGYLQDKPSAAGYRFMENEVNHLAKEMGWEPHQAQAAIWVAIKARAEAPAVKKAVDEKSEKKGYIHFEMRPNKDGKLTRQRVIDNAPEHRRLWIRDAMKTDPTEAQSALAGGSFADALKSYEMQVSWDALPTAETGALDGIHDAPIGQQQLYQSAIIEALRDNDGHDLIAKKLGIPEVGKVEAPGVWKGEINPGVQNLVLASAAKGGEGSQKMSEESASLLRTYAAIMGYVLKQQSVAYHRPFYSGSQKDHNGTEVNIGSPLSFQQARDFHAALKDELSQMGYDVDSTEFGLVSSMNGIRVIYSGKVADHRPIKNAVKSAAQRSISDHRIKTFATENELIENDWSVNEDGQDFKRYIRAAGRPDLLGWVDSVLAERVEAVNTKFAETYGWGAQTGQAEVGARQAERDRRDGGISDGGRRSRQSVQAARSDARDGQGQEAEAARGSDPGVSEPLARGELLAEHNYHKKNAFFSSVVTGQKQKPIEGVKYTPVVKGYQSNRFGGPFTRVMRDYDSRQGDFDIHIARSIPGFSEIQTMVADGILKTYGPSGATMLDIGGSEGNFDKTITKLSKGKIKTTVVDPNPDMRDAFAEGENVEGSDYSHTAFGGKVDAGEYLFDEKGEPIYGFEAAGSGQYDVIHEAMTFQFIDNSRAKHIAQVDEYLAPGGVAIFEEKFSDGPNVDGWAGNEAKKDDYKRKYFYEEDINAKAEAILTGMHGDQVTAPDMERMLSNQFDHVVQFWSAGNFKGYAASNDKLALQTLVNNIGDTSSEYAVEDAPKEVKDYDTRRATEAELGSSNRESEEVPGKNPAWANGGSVRKRSPAPEVASASSQFIGIHYGNVAGLRGLDPGKYGKGTQGDEKYRIGNDPVLSKRAHYYEQDAPGQLPESESVVNQSHVYRTQFDNIYDFASDPLKLVEPIKERMGGTLDMNALESHLIDLGFDGLRIAKGEFPSGVIVAIGHDTDIPAQYLGTRQEAPEILRAMDAHGLSDASTDSGSPKFSAGETVAERVGYQRRAKARAKKMRKSMKSEIGSVSRHIPVRISESHPSEHFDVDYADRIEAAYIDGEIVLFAGSIQNDTRARQVLMHEAVGHFGMEQVLGKQYEGALDGVRKLIASGRFDDVAEEVRRRYPDLDESGKEFPSEALAVMAERGQANIPVIKRAVAAVRRFLRSIGLSLDYTDNDILSALSAAGQYVNGKGRALTYRPVQGRVRGDRQPAFSRANPTFYSAMGQTLANKLPGKGPAPQIKQQIEAFAKKGQIKPEELEFSGVLEWLDEQGSERVTKEDVLDALAERGTRLEETVHDEGKPLTDAEFQRFNELAERRNARPGEAEPLSREESAEMAALEARLGESVNSDRRKYKDYSTPGGENYRELLIRLPSERKSLEPNAQQAVSKYGLTLAGTSVIDLKNAGASESEVDTFRRWLFPAEGGYKEYQSSHWDEPNVVAHLRTSERVSADGARTLLVDEVQSDWHQEGRTHGYRPEGADMDALKTNVRETRAAMSKIRERLIEQNTPVSNLAVRLGDLPVVVDATESNRHEAVRSSGEDAGLSSAQIDSASVLTSEFADATSRYQSANEALKNSRNKTPDAPFKKTWPLLAIKRAIRMAAENGQTRVAWTTGQMQAVRYDLSTTISKISYSEPADAAPGYRGNLVAETRNGENAINRYVARDELPEYIGKEAANNLLQQDSEPYGTAFVIRTLEGQQIAIGGSGMRSFYDNMLPKMVGKYIKKWGGSVSTTNISTRDSGGTAVVGREHPFRLVSGVDPDVYSVERISNDEVIGQDLTRDEAEGLISDKLDQESEGEVFHSFEITDDMRNAALEGQPMYSRRKSARQAFSERANERADEYEAEMATQLEALNTRIPTYISRSRPEDVLPEGELAEGAEGYFDGERIILFAGNLDSLERAQEVLRHEAVGHFGMMEMLGEEFAPTLDQVRALMNTSTEVMDIAQEVSERYDRFDPDTGRYHRLSRNSDTFLSEVIAVMAERGTDVPLMRRVLASVRRFLRQLKLISRDVSENDLRAMLARAGRYTKSGNRVLSARPTPAAASQSYPTFYSEMGRVLSEKLPESGTAQSYQKAVEAFVRKGQIKPEEYEWSGLPEMFNDADPNDSMDKEEVLDQVAQMGVVLEESVKQGAAEIDIEMGQEEIIEPGEDFIAQEAEEVYLDDAISQIAEEEGADKSEIERDEAMERAEEMARESYREEPETQISMTATSGGSEIEYTYTYSYGDSEIFRKPFTDAQGAFHEGGVIDDAEAATNIHALEQLVREDAEHTLAIDEDDAAQWKNIAANPSDDYQEVLLRLPMNRKRGEDRQVINGREIIPRAEEYESSHWSEPNVVAHIRMDTRTARKAEGIGSGNAVFIHEIQSDWHQEGLKEGYGSDDPAEVQRAYDAMMVADEAKGSYNNRLVAGDVPGVSSSEGAAIIQASRRDKADITDAIEFYWSSAALEGSPQAAHIDAANEMHGLVSAARDAKALFLDLTSGVPSAPFRKTWPVLAMKRAIKEAVDGNADYVTWTTGELSNAVSHGSTEWFYDRNLPNLTKKYIKKWGSKVEQFYVSNTESGDFGAMWGFEVTPEMREGVRKGQALFSRPKKEQNSKLIGINPDGQTVAAGIYTDRGEWVMVADQGWGAGVKSFATRKGMENAMKKAGLTVDSTINTERDQSIPSYRPEDFQMPAKCYFGDAGHVVQHYTQDKFSQLLRTQKAIEDSRGIKLTDASNPYQMEELFHGRARRQLETFNEANLDPMLRELARLPYGLKQVDEYLDNLDPEIAERYRHLTAMDAYLYARHAKEANAQLEQINPGEESMSGMSDTEADAIMSAFAQKGDTKSLERMAKKVDAITEKTRQTLVQSGLEAQDVIDQWEATYDHYVPLKGEPGTEYESAVQRFLGRVGRGFDSKGQSTQRRLGRNSPAQNILANVVSAHYSTIRRAEKNRVAKAMLRLARENNNTNLWTVDTPLTKRALDKTEGLVINVPDQNAKDQDEVFVARVNGIEHHVVFNKHNPDAMRMASALKNLDAQQMNAVVKVGHSLNGWLSMANTQINPEFVVTNLLRDLQTAALNLSETEAKNLKAKVIKDVPKAGAAIFARTGNAESRKNVSKQWHQYAEDFFADGGATGWQEGYESMDAFTKKLKRDLSRETPGTWGFAQKSWKNTWDAIGRMNGSVENAVRLSAYAHAREAGMSRDKAASIAKNLTVNFNRKGEWGNGLNAGWLFYNASIQGSARILKATRNSPRIQAQLFGLMSLSAAMTIMNFLVAGEDEDGRNNYQKIPEYIKEGNWTASFPDGQKVPDWVPDFFVGENGEYMKVPLPYGYNVVQYFGQKLGMAILAGAGMVPDYDPMEEAMHAALAPLNAFNPMGGTVSPAQFVSPTLTDPLVQWAENKNWAGIPLRPEQSPYGPPKPNYQMHFSGARSWSKYIAKELNMGTGGTTTRPGGVNISPEMIDMMTDFFGGGVARFASETAELGVRAFDPNQDLSSLESHQIPFLGKVYGTERDQDSRSLYYDRRGDMEYLKEDISAFKSARKDRAKKAELDRMEARIKENYPRQLSILPMYKQMDKRLSELTTKQHTIEDRRNITEKQREGYLEPVMRDKAAIYHAFNRLYKMVVLEGKDPQESYRKATKAALESVRVE